MRCALLATMMFACISISKTKGMGADMLRMVDREGMLERVHFGGEWDDVKRLYRQANAADAMTVWVQPGVTSEEVKARHREGKAVVVNFFSEYPHDGPGRHGRLRWRRVLTLSMSTTRD